jgi:hypothetical protein
MSLDTLFSSFTQAQLQASSLASLTREIEGAFAVEAMAWRRGGGGGERGGAGDGGGGRHHCQSSTSRKKAMFNGYTMFVQVSWHVRPMRTNVFVSSPSHSPLYLPNVLFNVPNPDSTPADK